VSLAWYAKRLARMSSTEIARRIQDELLKQRWRWRQVVDGALDPLPVPGAVPRFRSGLESFDPATLPRDMADEIVTAAQLIRAGRIRTYDCVREDMVSDPDWFLDPRTGRRASQLDYTFDINYRDGERIGAVKYIWEPSRHQHLTVLAAGFFLSGDHSYADAAARQLFSWWRQNPFLSGIHWTSGIELGIRLISWVWLRRLLDHWFGVQELFEGNSLFLRQLHHHQDYLACLPSHGSSANNHLIAEAAGQFAACCAFPYFNETKSWREKALATLCREIERQTFPSGLNRELATGYHLFVLELCLAAGVEGEASGWSPGSAFWATACGMVDALAAVIDARGRPPRQGDDDLGRGLMLDGPDESAAAAALTAGGELFGACPWWPQIGPVNLRARLWRHLLRRRIDVSDRPAARPNLFADAGMVILRDVRSGGEEIWCRCDHGPHGYLSIAAHAHADALSVELRCGGVDVLADPGTYTYEGARDWRAYFRSTISHNCLELAGVDQSITSGPFLWSTVAQAALCRVTGLDHGAIAEWTAEHDGYQRLRPPAVHRRTVRLFRGAGRLEIWDKVVSTRSHPCRLAFHLGPDVEGTLGGRLARLSWRGDRGEQRAILDLPQGLRWRTIRGAAQPPLGWYSPYFGAKVPTTTFLGEGRIDPSQCLITVIRFEPHPT
jgi:hypothetical protein